MRIILQLFCVIFVAFANAGVAAATAQTAPQTGALTLDDVLASSAAHFPKVLESLSNRRAAAGKALAAQGAFDLVFSSDGFTRATGFWDGSVINTEARKNLRPLGASVYGGYRLSDGAFPIYEDINFTNTGGEAKIGVLFSLLRNRAIDARRTGELAAALDVTAADLDVLLTQIGVQHQGQLAYWRWVTAGRQLETYENLLRIAKARESGLEEQVRQGARASIFLVENRQNITRRQILATEAQRQFLSAANALSLYYRDASGAPKTPVRAQLPPLPPLEETSERLIAEVDAGAPLSTNALLARRPELGLIAVAFQKADADLRLAQNDLKPQLDLGAEVSHDFGAIAEGGISRDSTDTVLKFNFSVPLERRTARGRIRAAEAARDALRQRQRQMEDEIGIEVRNILVDLNMSQQLVLLAVDEAAQSDTMQSAERRRFNSGASDFFLLNIREETAADARIRYHRAALNARVARANYDAATVNLERLGLGDAGF